MDSRKPAAYLRRSQEGGITKEDEIAALKALAVREGANGELVWFDDWGHSADDTKDQQDRLRDLIADMRAGRINLVIAGKMDRLARSVSVFAKFAAATKEHHVRFVTVAEGDMSEDAVDDDPFKWASRQFMVTMAEMELRTIKARVRRSQRVRTERGDKLGRPGYGWHSVQDETSKRIIHVPDDARPADLVVDAYREAKSIMGCAKLLQARGVKAPKGGTRWGQSTVTRILEREAPELFPRPSRIAGRRTPTNSMFAGLLACACGATLTPNRVRNQYYCPWGHRLGSAVHGKITTSELAVQGWIDDELEHFEKPVDQVEMEAQIVGRREAVTTRLEKAREDWYANRIDRKKWDAEQARATDDLDAMDSTETIFEEWPDFDALNLWTLAPADISRILRSIFVRVDLGKDMLPTSATWRNPALRQRCDDAACTHCPAQRRA
jgi:DNA invertase Pin-like site-specific DNA recombinase